MLSQQLEDANRELEQAISANEAFRRNVLEPAARTAALPPSTLGSQRGPGAYSSSLLAKWASIPAAPVPSYRAASHGVGAGAAASTSTSSASTSHHHHPSQHADPLADASTYLRNSGGAFDKLDGMLQAAMLKESERVDSHVRDVVARDADARASHLDNVLRGRFAELQANSESTGQVLSMIGETLKAMKAETVSLARQFDEKSARLVERVAEDCGDKTAALTRAVDRLDKRVVDLEAALQTERMARATRMDAVELRVSELRSQILGHVEKKTSDVRDELRAIDADVATLHREWAKQADVSEEVRHLRAAMRELIDDAAGQRSDVRQIKADVLNLDVFMRVRAQGRSGIDLHGGERSSSPSPHGGAADRNLQAELHQLRESVSFLAAAMKHHGLLSVEGPAAFARASRGSQQQQQHADDDAEAHNQRGATTAASAAGRTSHHHHEHGKHSHHAAAAKGRHGSKSPPAATAGGYTSSRAAASGARAADVPPLAYAQSTPRHQQQQRHSNHHLRPSVTAPTGESADDLTGSFHSADEADSRLVRSPID